MSAGGKYDPKRARRQIIDSFTRTLFVQAYATFVEQANEDGEDTSDLPQPGPGEDWMDSAPETPESAVQAGLDGIAAIEKRYGVPIEELAFIASEECLKTRCHASRDHNAEAFGHYLAMQYVGHGVSWSDDHAMQLDLPHGEFNIGSREEAGLPPTEEDALRWNPERENGTMRGARRANPEGAEIPAFVKPAVAGYEDFQAFSPRMIGTLRGLVIPTQICLVGEAVQTLYRSDKWENKKHDYYHDHDPGVRIGRTDVSGAKANPVDAPDTLGPMVAVPAEIAGKRDGIAIYKLGDCLGFTYSTPEGETIEAKVRSPLPELYATASRKVLLVIDTSGSVAKVLAILWGGSLRVEDRGIVG